MTFTFMCGSQMMRVAPWILRADRPEEAGLYLWYWNTQAHRWGTLRPITDCEAEGIRSAVCEEMPEWKYRLLEEVHTR